jgi:hypothetical protein
MSFLRSRAAIVVALTLITVSMLGASLGVATANQRNTTLVPGFNLIGGPLFASIEPDDFMGCFPDGSWEAIYIWNAEEQSWSHFFAESANVPDYVNDEEVGGIQSIPQLSGVVVIMNTQVQSPFVPDDTSQVAQCQ